MDHTHALTNETWWLVGWLIAVGVLFAFAVSRPLKVRQSGPVSFLYSAGIIAAFAGVLVLANVALERHHVHFDLTREKIYTPSARAMQVVRDLEQPVEVAYFYRGDDERGRRAKKIVELMGDLNPLLDVVTADPDKSPDLARSVGAKTYNSAVVSAAGRRLVVTTVDETEIALAIQRVLRQHVVRICFMQGHNEFPPDSYEFHTHVEGLAGHEHDGDASAVIQTPGHGIGRLRRALESIGYEISQITPALDGSISSDCRVVIAANPRTTFLPGESRMLERYLSEGGALLAMFDLGFSLEPGLASLIKRFGIELPQAQVIDEKSHYSTSAEMVAVTGYDKHPVTRSVSFTFYPGIRPLVIGTPAAGLTVVPLIMSSTASRAKPVAAVAEREVAAPRPMPASLAGDAAAKAHVLAAAVEGSLASGGEKPFRAIVVGDADFASNSFFPFMSNNHLAISMVRWLAREETGTAIATRVRVPELILLTGGQIQAIFALLVGGLPLLVLGLGGLVWWVRR